MGGKDILLSLVTSAELHCKVNPLRRTEVPAKKICFPFILKMEGRCVVALLTYHVSF